MFRKLLSVIVLFVLVTAPISAFGAESKMGYINMRKVFFEYKKTKAFNEELEKKDEALKKEMEGKTQVIRKMRDEIELLSDKAKEKKEPELRQKLKELDDFRKDKIESFLRDKDEKFKEIREDILTVSTAYAKKNGYDMIFDEAIFVYAVNKFDITDDIIKDLNK
jgi:outer membrane protein